MSKDNKKNKFLIFDIFTGEFTKDLPEEVDFKEYLDIAKAEKDIALRMIKQRLDKISPEDYEESTD